MVVCGSIRVPCRQGPAVCGPACASPAARARPAEPHSRGPMVGDDMFATEGDSANVGRQRTATRENGRSGGPAPVADDGGPGGEVSADVLRRLRERVDRNVRLVDRMRADPLAPEPPGLPELIDTA